MLITSNYFFILSTLLFSNFFYRRPLVFHIPYVLLKIRLFSTDLDSSFLFFKVSFFLAREDYKLL